LKKIIQMMNFMSRNQFSDRFLLMFQKIKDRKTKMIKILRKKIKIKLEVKKMKEHNQKRVGKLRQKNKNNKLHLSSILRVC